MTKSDDNNRQVYNLEQRDIFNRTVELFDQPLPPEIAARLEEIVVAAELQPGSTVLDVGAGVGALTERIMTTGPGRVIACDISPKMLARLGELFPGAERHLADVVDLELETASLDVVFMNAVFSNIVDKKAALANTARMLKDGGRLVVSHPEGRGYITKLKAHIPFELDDLPNRNAWDDLLQGHPLTTTQFIDEPALYIAIASRAPR